MRTRIARGVIVNSAFTVALQSLGLVRGFVVAAFLTRSDYGVWGVLAVGLLTVGWLRQVGIADRYVQQDDADQEAAFHEAFTAELVVALSFTALFALVVPVLALAYGEPSVLLPGWVMALALPASAFQVGAWIFYRNMDFVRQRLLYAVDPIVGGVVAVVVAVAGGGPWALVAGMVAGAWSTSLVAVWRSPYRLRLRVRRSALRAYARFSWPLMVGAGASAAMIQGMAFASHAALGLAGVGTIALAGSVSAYADRVDDLLAAALYPAICAAKDRRDLLYEAFVKSNRLALIWAAPYGVGLALFAPYLADVGLGERWRPALHLVQVFGLVAAVNHVAFNWGSYYTARAETRPIAVVKVVSAVAFLMAAVPLILLYGLTGLAIGLTASTGVTIAVRAHYVRRLFPRFRMRTQIVRGFGPVVPAAMLVLAMRWAAGALGFQAHAAELVVFVLTATAATVALERPLLLEVLDYLRSQRGEPVAVDGAVA
jgi:lipopolysaccharide exporter